MKNIKKLSTVLIGLSLASVSLGSVALAIQTQNQSEYQVASALANCRQVSVPRGKLNVRSRPSTGSAVIGSLNNGSLVAINPDADIPNNWIRVLRPVRGYAAATYLKPCR